ncbi:TetR/AcrR family transcriptional regulator [Brevibacterium oceani]|uniref:TetR/AcrR family transcriptional regulator n=1 Tax=Brevibacterium oceani TaxID=358099 RepID=UPI0015E76A47|nr:TetR/AcrR family transcriptional regulator [Brevibacterium oceani]
MSARTGRPSLSQEEIADRRGTVITATLELISERGTSGIRLKDVARSAGISVGTIQYYFDSREDLILSAYQQHSQNVIALVRASFREGTDPWTSLAQTFHDFFHVADFSNRTRLWIEFVAAATRDDELRGLLDEVFLAWKQVIRRIVEAGIADGSFVPQLEAETAIDALLAQLDGFEIAHATGAAGTNVERIESVLQRTARVLLGAPQEPIDHLGDA